MRTSNGVRAEGWGSSGRAEPRQWNREELSGQRACCAEAEPRSAWPGHREENIAVPLVPTCVWASLGLSQVGPYSEALDLGLGLPQRGKP